MRTKNHMLARRSSALSHLPLAALFLGGTSLAQPAPTAPTAANPVSPVNSTVQVSAQAGPSASSTVQTSAATLCPPKWIPTFGQGTDFGQGIVSTAVLDDGSGSALFTAHRFQVAGIPGYTISKWDGSQLSTVGGSLNGSVAEMVTFDDGTGPALYAGGSFLDAAGTYVDHVAKWNGTNWSAVGDELEEQVVSLIVFDDGSGDSLYAVESYLEQQFLDPEWHVSKWNGTSWSSVGPPSYGYAGNFTVFDDGSGPGLYLSIDIPQGSKTIRKLTGTNWNTIVGNASGSISSIETFNDGTGDTLYAVGSFNAMNGVPANLIAKLDSLGTWSAVGAPGGVIINEVVLHDDGTGPALHAYGEFSDTVGGPLMDIGKWDGQSWTPLGNGLGTPAFVAGLESFDDGTGASLYAGGGFASVPDSGDQDLARWGTPDTCGPGEAYCFGDGTGTACPCGNSGAPGNGCANSSNPGGSVLQGFGEPSFFLDSFGLFVGGARPNVPGLVLLASGQFNQGLGSPVGSGLLCVGGFVQRSQVQLTNNSGSTSFNDFQGSPFGATAFGVGSPVNYQFWYRDSASGCSGGPFNFSNAWTATWQP